MPLILASTSPIRRPMLDAAGVAYRGRAAPTSTRRRSRRRMTATTDAWRSTLAEAKALTISRAAPGDWVIGSDSAGQRRRARCFDKPREPRRGGRASCAFLGPDDAADQRGRAGARRRDRLEPCPTARRSRSARCREDFIDTYLDAEWPEVAYCVGVFRMEGRGVTLFERVEGNHFTILGMPLLPLLGALRERGLMPS